MLLTFVVFGHRLIINDTSLQLPPILSKIREQAPAWEVIDSCRKDHTSREGVARFQEDVLLHDPDLVAIMFGVNDALKMNPVSVQEYANNLRYMVGKLPPQRTVLMCPPLQNHHLSPHTNERIGQYAQETKAIAFEKGCAFIELATLISKDVNIQSLQKTLARKLIGKLHAIESTGRNGLEEK